MYCPAGNCAHVYVVLVHVNSLNIVTPGGWENQFHSSYQSGGGSGGFSSSSSTVLIFFGIAKSKTASSTLENSLGLPPCVLCV